MLTAGAVGEGSVFHHRLARLAWHVPHTPLGGHSLPSDAPHASLWASSSRFFFKWLGRGCCPPVPRGPCPAVLLGLSESAVLGPVWPTLRHLVTRLESLSLTLLSLRDLFTCPPAALRAAPDAEARAWHHVRSHPPIYDFLVCKPARSGASLCPRCIFEHRYRLVKS